MKQVLCKINKKILYSAFAVIFCLSLGKLIETVLVLQRASFSLSLFQTYITMIIGILSAFLVVPLFTFKSKESNYYSHSFLLSVSFVILLVILITLALSPAIVKSMAEKNPKMPISELWLFIIFSNVGKALGILETFLTFKMIFQNKVRASVIFSVVGLLIRALFLFLLLSNISPFQFHLWYITLASFVSTVIGVSLLLFFYWSHNKDNKLPLNLKKSLEFYKNGILPALEKALGGGAYLILTLGVIKSLKKTEAAAWPAWGLADMVLLWGVMNVTLILRYSLYYETISSSDYKYLNALQKYLLIFDLIIFIVMTLFFAGIIELTLTDPKKLAWKPLAIKTLFAMAPFMLLEEVKKQFEIRLTNKRVFYLILINTILDVFLIKMPIYFLYTYNIIHITYWINYAIWAGGITFVVTLTAIEFNWIKNKPDTRPIILA